MNCKSGKHNECESLVTISVNMTKKGNNCNSEIVIDGTGEYIYKGLVELLQELYQDEKTRVLLVGALMEAIEEDDVNE